MVVALFFSKWNVIIDIHQPNILFAAILALVFGHFNLLPFTTPVPVMYRPSFIHLYRKKATFAWSVHYSERKHLFMDA